MNFRQWFEMSHLADADTSEIELEKYGRGWTYPFYHNEELYRVTMEPTEDQFAGEDIPVWDVTFTGPKGYSLTYQSGGAATAIYSQLILAMKKLLEVESVTGLHFTPAEASMAVMYNRFYKQFLQKQFMQVKHGLYLDKDYLREMIKARPYRKASIYKSIIDFNRNKVSYNKGVRDNKVYERQLRVALPKLIHTFVRHARYYDGRKSGTAQPAFLLKAQGFDVVMIRQSEYGSVYMFKDDGRGIELNNPLSDAEIIEFLKEAAQSEYRNDEEFKFLHPYYQKYHLPIPQPYVRQEPQYHQEPFTLSPGLPVPGPYIDPP